jgi:lysophospholipase L1-like esterase
MKSILFWGLFPFMLPQAIVVRKTAPKVVEADGAKEGTIGNGKSYKFYAIGDSIISGVGAEKITDALSGQTAKCLAESLNCQINWASRGIIGATSKKIRERLIPKLPTEKADFIVVSAGVNDLTTLSSLSKYERNLSDLLNKLGEHSPNAIIAMSGIPPLRGFPLLPQPLRALFGIRGESFDKVIQKVVAKNPNLVYVPLDFEPTPDKFSVDGFHPSEESYKIFGQIVAEKLVERFKQNEKETVQIY